MFSNSKHRNKAGASSAHHPQQQQHNMAPTTTASTTVMEETTAMLNHHQSHTNTAAAAVENESTKSYNSTDDASLSAEQDGRLPSLSPVSSSEHSRSSGSHKLMFSLMGAIANLCSATLGAGVLALPYALYQAGLVWGAILLLFAAISTLHSLQLLVEACRYYNVYTYEQIVQLALGQNGRTVTEVSILLFCGGCAVAYAITIGDICEMLGWNRNVAMLLVWSIAMVPLSLLRTMTSLQHASGVGIFSICFLIAVANVHYWQDKLSSSSSSHESPSSPSRTSNILWPAHGMSSVLMACPLIIFAFSCQPNVCAIYHELGQKQYMPIVLQVAVGVCAFLYTSISLAAFLDFGTVVQPNVLQNYCLHSVLIQCAFVGMTIAVVMAFPLNIFPTRVTLEGLIWGEHRHPSELEMEDTSSSVGDNGGSGLSSHHNDVQEPLLGPSSTTGALLLDESSSPFMIPAFSTSRHVGLTLAITSLVLILAMVAPNISVVFGLLGGTTSSVIGFILPGLVGNKVLHTRRQRWKAKLLVIGGVVIGILTTAVTIYSTFVAPPPDSPHYDPCNVTSSSSSSSAIQGNAL